jgi:hypothetical protein
MSQMRIDGKWVECGPADGFGALGVREVAELGSLPGHPPKRLLLRHVSWPQAGSPPLRLTVNTVPEIPGLGLRRVAGKAYRVLQGQSVAPERCQVFQQDVTGLVPFRQAILRAIAGDEPERVWRLFLNACRTLNGYGKAAGSRGRGVPLQLPESLAVDPDGGVVPLDGEVTIAGLLPADGPAEGLYRTWFGERGLSGRAAGAGEASVLHGRALLEFLRRLLESQKGGAETSSRVAAAKLLTHFEGLPPGSSLDDVENWILDASGQDERRGPAVVRAVPTAIPVPPRPATPRRGCWPLLASMLLNLLLVLVASSLALLLLRAGGESLFRPRPPADEVPFSPYCVVLPAEGTIGEKVQASLEAMFPRAVAPVPRDQSERDRLLREKMAEVVKSLDEPDKLKALLDRLAGEGSVRFKGFGAGGPGEGLAYVIEKGGIFTLVSKGRETHGSLLQPDGLEKVLAGVDPAARSEARRLLAGLRNAAVEYAAYKDALNIAGDRAAFLVRVGAAAEAHAEARRKLLGRLDKPVFVSRPVLELFDSVDPTADTGGGSAVYTLRLDRRCYWRQAGAEDRRGVDYEANTSNARMKWQAFEPGATITWRPIPLTRKNGKTGAVASFDVAVVLDDKVVVFRNQGVYVGETREQVAQQGRNYVRQGLGLRVGDVQDVLSVSKVGDQFTGALKYSALAELVAGPGAPPSGDVELYKPAEFQSLRNKEDQGL